MSAACAREFRIFIRGGATERLQLVYPNIFRHFGVTCPTVQREVLRAVGLRADGPRRLVPCEPVVVTSRGWRPRPARRG